MLKKLLGLDTSQDVDQVELAFRGGWFFGLLLAVAAIIFVVYLYRRETSVPRNRRIAMMTLQFAALFTLIILVVMQPFAKIRMTKEFKRSMIVLLDTSKSMAIDDPRSEIPDVEEAAKALNQIPLDRNLRGDDAQSVQQTLGTPRRIDLAQGALNHPEMDVLGKLAEQYDVRFFTFDSEVRSADAGADSGDGDDLHFGGFNE